jgi:hypothetical protein
MTRPGRVLGAASPEGDTPAGFLYRAPAVQAGPAVQPMRGKLAAPRPAPKSPQSWEHWFLWVTQEGDRGGLPGPPRHAQRRTQQQNTSYTPPATGASIRPGWAGSTVLQQTT